MTESRMRQPLFTTAAGSKVEAFGPGEWALLTAVALMWGSAFFFIEVGLESFEPGLITAARIGLGFVTLSLFPQARRKIDRTDWPRVIVLGLTWVAIPFLLLPIAQQHVDSALTGMLNALVPVFATVFAAFFLRTPPRPVQLAGILIGFLGAAGISITAIGDSDSSAFGITLVAAAMVFYGLSINLAVPLQHRYGGPTVMARALGVATAATAPFGIVALPDSSWGLSSAISVAVLGVFASGVAFVVMTAFVGRVGPTRGGVAIYFIPVVAIILGVAFRGETVTPLQIAGTGVVLLGAWLTSRRETPSGEVSRSGSDGL